MNLSEKLQKIATGSTHKLVLENGTEFPGYGFGALANGSQLTQSECYEVVFNTSMVGYQEVITDPSYHRQMVVMTYPHQGNYGLNSTDVESRDGRPQLAGFIVRDFTVRPSNFTSEMDLDQYLTHHNIPALFGVDTRQLTIELRTAGVMRGVIAAISTDARSIAWKASSTNHMAEVSTKQPYWYAKTGRAPLVAVLDFGVKTNLLRELQRRGVDILVMPHNSSAEAILAEKPAGVFLSNGPGDPAVATNVVAQIHLLLGKVPIFGVCMGHQLLGMALGGKTYKMKFGHRGINQPVQNLKTGAVEISSHNHGYAVDVAGWDSNLVTLTHINLNDRTCEGISAERLKAFSVQYHPESAPGPHDSGYLFDDFIKLIHTN